MLLYCYIDKDNNIWASTEIPPEWFKKIRVVALTKEKIYDILSNGDFDIPNEVLTHKKK